jgi:RNA polymerase sigma factor (sigma-70 family)
MMVAGLTGDATAYHKLLSSIAPMLRTFFRRRLRDAEDDVEDLVQETLIAIHGKRATYDSQRPLTAWVYALARYKMIDMLRRARPDVSIELLEEILAGEDFEDAVSARMDVDRLLDSLPVKQSRVIRDTKIDGLSVAETAEKEGLSVADVKVSVHRGLKTLALRLRGE